jgi:hypothetical protein
MLIEWGRTSEKPRVAVAVFYSLPTLDLALDAMFGSGVLSSDMTIVSGSPVGGSLAAALTNQEMAFRNIPVRARARAAPRRRGGEVRLLDIPFENWGTTATARTVGQCLAEGACALIVLTIASELERAVLKVLLANSVGPVQQHDVA